MVINERAHERRMPDDSAQRKDYPEVQFTLSGDEGKTPEELEEEIELILLKRHYYEAMFEIEQKYKQNPDSAE